MVALDFHASDFAPSFSARYGALLRTLTVFLATAIVVLTGLSVRDASGWSVAADEIWRFSAFVFAAALAWEPAVSLLPREARESLAPEAGTLTAFFVLTYAAYLAFTFAPNWLDKTEPVIAMRLFGALAAAATVILAVSALPRWPGALGQTLQRAVQFVALGFFWVLFVMCGIDHLYGPHRPDSFFGIAVLALVGALLVRFLAAFVQTVKMALAHAAQRRALGAIARA
jgi:hypothetical protein